MSGKHPWTGGEPTDVTYMATKHALPQSIHYYHLQEPTEAHKQLKTKNVIITFSDSEDPKNFSQDEKDMTAEELAKFVINHMEFIGMDLEFWLPDPQNPTKLCNIL